MGLLDGKVGIVTGAGHGIGRGHAMELARHGAKVVVNDLGGSVGGEGTSKDADLTVKIIESRGGVAVANYEDVADHEGATLLIEVRCADADLLHRGDQALIFDFDPERGCFEVTACDATITCKTESEDPVCVPPICPRSDTSIVSIAATCFDRDSHTPRRSNTWRLCCDSAQERASKLGR